MKRLIDRGRLAVGLESGPPIIWIPRAQVYRFKRDRVLILGLGWWMLYIGWRS